jgi:hypothetical protein
MVTETVLRTEAIDLLIKAFGVLDTQPSPKSEGSPLDAERFITSIKSNHFDYTEWHKNLWADKTIDEIHEMATEFENKKYNKI